MSDFDEAARMADSTAGFPTLEPKRIKVFGILHIVFGGLGIAGTLMTLVMTALQDSIIKLASSGPGVDEYTRISLELAEKLTTMTYVGLAFGAVLAVFLLVSGIWLVKRKPAGLTWSNRYAWLSIVFKVVSVLLCLAVTIPIVNGFLDPILAEAAPDLATQLQVLKWTQVAAGVLGPLLSMVYPILALVMLNKKVVTDFFAGQPQ